MKYIFLLLILFALISCDNFTYTSSDDGIGATLRLKIDPADLPPAFKFVANAGVGFEIYKFQTNYFLIQRIRVTGASYYDIVPIQYKEE